jgi:hypothetical protein
MTLAEYLDPTRFPLTTRAALSAADQFRLDAAHLAKLRAYLAGDVTPTEDQWLRLEELEEKAKARPELLARLGGADAGS